jgi:hypothetical protein
MSVLRVRRRKPRTAEQVVRAANELARELYSAFGYAVPDGFRFDRATNGRQKMMWDLAAVAIESIEGTDINEARSELEDTP